MSHQESVIEEVIPPSTVDQVEEDDLDIRVAPRTEVELPDICLACARPTKKHTATQAYKCMMVLESRRETFVAEEDEEDDDPLERPGDWYLVTTVAGREESVLRRIEARLMSARQDSDVIRKKEYPGYLLVRCELNGEVVRLIRTIPDVSGFVGPNGGKPLPMARKDVKKFLVGDSAKTTPTKRAHAKTPEPAPAAPVPNVDPDAPFVDEAIRTEQVVARVKAEEVLVPEVVAPGQPLTANGELDYEALAAAMRTVIEKERDEVIRRGGPLEKQNIKLKEDKAELLDLVNMWRNRAQIAATQRNTMEGQLNAAIKENRRLRNELKGRRENNHVRFTELEDILNVVDKAPGWTREMGGNGHWQIKRNGVFITDAASSGGSTKVNMATRTKLRKAGLEV